MYGTQTLLHPQPYDCMFENDVKMYGTQTVWTCSMDAGQFENDVKMYGTQTVPKYSCISSSLRMM